MAFFLTLQTRRRGHQLGSLHRPRPLHRWETWVMPLNEYEPGNRVPWPDRADDGGVQPGVAPAATGGRRLPERAVHRARRRRLRAAGLLRQPDRDAEPGRAGRGRPAVYQYAHHGAVLPVAVVHHHRAQSPRQRHGGDQRARDRLPGLQRPDPVRERFPVGDAAAARLQHLHGRQVPPDALGIRIGGGAVRPLAARARFRALLRVPGR